MVADVLWAAAPPLVAGVALSFLMERMLLPGTVAPWRRPAAALAIHVSVWLLLFAIELAVFRRPWFAAANVMAFMLLVVLVNNAKFHSLREPFVFQDFEYFTDAIKHPRLYLPFLGVWNALLAVAAFALALYTGLTLEPAMTAQVSRVNFYGGVGTLAVLAFSLLWLGARQQLAVIFDPEADLRGLGLIASLWRYGEEERSCHCIPSAYDFAEPAQDVAARLQNLVVVQSESFFDARDLFSGIRPEVLREFDSIGASATCQGKLTVPAWGANTVRTEFAFLSGWAARHLGVHRFNPYRKLARQGVSTLASFLRKRGYRTVCVHPYPASFYARDVVFPLLGFDEFVDIRSFDEAGKSGPYIGDAALAEKVCALLGSDSGRPIFVYVITMENHGPLHLEKVLAGDVERLYANAPPQGCEDLTIYLRHLNNADRMAGMLRTRLSELPGHNWLCWFGDHVPIMPAVYKALGAPRGETDYFIWEKGGSPCGKVRLDLEVENLGTLLLSKMGLVGARPKVDATGESARTPLPVCP